MQNSGWWRAADDRTGDGGRDLDGVVQAVVADLDAGRPVALGFEAPLFVPRPATAEGLNKQRRGEHGRPWCVGAGSGSLAFGIQQATYVLSGIARQVRARPSVSFDPTALLRGEADLVVWEAFVTGAAKNRQSSDPHVDDARAAVTEFRRRLAEGSVDSDIVESDVLSLAGAALLSAGLSDDVALLRESCIVVRAPDFVPATPA
jgi:hypothetical protein